MAQEKNTSKLDTVQAALLDDRDFLKGIVETFCQRLLEEEMVDGAPPTGRDLPKNRETTRLS